MELERKKIRLQEKNYSSLGAYFITICTYNKRRLFGYRPIVPENWYKETGLYQYGNNITENGSSPMPVGATLCGSPWVLGMIEKWICEIPRKFKFAKIDYYVIMPNHVHLILFISDEEADGLPHRVAPTDKKQGESVPQVLDWFKTMTTNEYIRAVKQGLLPPFENHLWQRGYFDHVIRNRDDLSECRRYIKKNPKNNTI